MIPTPPLTAFRHGLHRMNAAMSRHDRLHPVGNRATHPMGLRRGRARAAWCLLAMLLVAAPVVVPGAATAQGLPQPGSRGQMLYGNHCIACHTTQMHWRDKRLVTDWPSLKVQVRRWQGTAQLNWSEEDIDDVARFLNDAYYQLPGGKVAGLRLR